MSRAKELTKNTLIITVGRISTQFVTFLLLPLYTALLSTEEYGTVDLITTLVQLLIPIVSIMIDQGVFRYLLNCETEEQRSKAISSAFAVLLGTSAATIVLYFIIGVFISASYKIWLLLILLVTAFSHLFLQIARGLKHTGDYAIGSFFCSASTILLNVICIAFLRMGAVGMLIATFSGNLLCCILLFFKLRIYNYIRINLFDKTLAKEELKYSAPLVPNQLSLWVMNSSDRLIVSFILGTAANGILAVSHKFPTIYMTFFNVFQLAWHETGAVHYFDEDRDEFFTEMIERLVSIFSTLCMCVLVVLPLVFDLFVKGAFASAYYNVPIYLIAFLFNVVIGVLGVVYVATKKTTEIAKTTMISAAINIIVHLALIKLIGLYAASISTFAGYLITLIYRIIDTKKYINIKYNHGQFIRIGLSLLVCCYIYYLRNKVISLAFFPFFILAAVWFNRVVVKDAWNLLNEKFGSKIGKKGLISIILAIIMATLLCGGLYVNKKIQEKTPEIQESFDREIKDLTPQNVVFFQEFGEEDFTCTGLTYDMKLNCFWIADYGKVSKSDRIMPRLVAVNRELTEVVRVIELNELYKDDINLQGIAYDVHRDEIWMALGNQIVSLNKEGEVSSSFAFNGGTGNRANGIAYDAESDTLWILGSSRCLFNFDTSGDMIDKIDFSYSAQDHLTIHGANLFATVGDDYEGDHNYVCSISIKDGSLNSLYKIIGSNAVEGITFYDGKAYICNDGLYHSDAVGKSYITIYDLNDFK